MTSSATENDVSPLWEFVSIADYSLPAAPVAQAVKKGLAAIRHKFRRDQARADSPLKREDELRTLPHWQLEQVAPASDWRGAAEALTVELEDWLGQEKPAPPILVLVGPPHSGHADILTAWAKGQTWLVLDPPSPEQVLAGDDTWLSNQSGAGRPWVFPVLERAYLRHAGGLGLMRRFLDQACSGNLGRGIIACDSWAWAFLQQVWRGPLSVILTPQAFDQGRLADHFQRLAHSSSARQLLFRQSDNGRFVLPPPDPDEAPGETSNYLQLLAAHSRGICGVAWAGWRASLRTEPDEETAEQAEIEERAIPHRAVWVTPWDQLKHPSLPAGAGRDEAFVLHTLLLHNGLALELLRHLLPLSPSQVMETLFRLEQAGLVAQHDAAWRVSALGYPAVRHFLQTEGYLVDQF